MSPEAENGSQFSNERKDFAMVVAEEADVTGCTPGFLQRLASKRLWHIEVSADPAGQVKAFIWKKVLVWSRNHREAGDE